jgi:hypothetical protein
MNSMALWATVILVMTLPDATSRANIVIGDTARACTRIFDAAEPLEPPESMGWVRLGACTSRLLINAREQLPPLGGSDRYQQRLGPFQ